MSATEQHAGTASGAMQESGGREQRPTVTATRAALEVIKRLRKAHGDLSFFQSGGCCEGSAPMCLRSEEMPMGPGDTWLGEIGGVPFYIDTDQYERWGRPRFQIDVSEGAADSFSLEGGEGVHFVTNTIGGSETCEV